MRIGIYVDIFKNNLTGIGRYNFELIKRLPTVLPEFEFVFFSQRDIKYKPLDVPLYLEKNEFLKKLPAAIWYKYFSYKLINNLNLDYLWSPIPILPNHINITIQKVINLYDFNLYIVPGTMDYKTWAYYKLYFKNSIMNADKIITISKGTALKLKQYFGRDADEIIYPGVDTNIFKKRNIPEKMFDFKYILSVSTIEPRKNINSLIEAFIDLKKEGFLKDIKLVLVGKNGWKNKDILRKMNAFKDDILYLGFVSDSKLAALYNGAEVFVFPSIYEGFGIPVLEARSCGCCVITTDIEELKEACGRGCIYTKPDKNSLKESLRKFFYRKSKCSDDSHIYIWDEEVKKLQNIFIEQKTKLVNLEYNI